MRALLRSARLRRGLAAAAVAVLGAGAALAGPSTPASAAGYTGPHPGAYTGLGFDTCAAPSSAAMNAWLASPYRAIGIYIGGVNRGCAQPNLTKEWVAAQAAAGWRFFPALRRSAGTLLAEGLERDDDRPGPGGVPGTVGGRRRGNPGP